MSTLKDKALPALAGGLFVSSLWLMAELHIPAKVYARVMRLIRGEKWRLRRVRDGFSGTTEDMSLFYGMDPAALTTTEEEARFLPADFYADVIRLLPVLCIDIAIERPADGKFLLVKRGSEPVKGFYWWPGGRILRGETFYGAALRKTREETGIEAAEPLGVLGVYNTYFQTSNWGGSTQTVNVVVHLRLTSDNDVKLDATSEEHCWVSPSEAHKYDPYVQEVLGAVKSRFSL